MPPLHKDEIQEIVKGIDVPTGFTASSSRAISELHTENIQAVVNECVGLILNARLHGATSVYMPYSYQYAKSYELKTVVRAVLEGKGFKLINADVLDNDTITAIAW